MAIKTELKVKSIELRQKEGGEWGQADRIYFFVPDYSVMENLENRRHRPYNEFRLLIPEVLKQATKKAKASKKNADCHWDEDTKARWSQKAGCSCGCSPGFVLDTHEGRDIFVDLKS